MRNRTSLVTSVLAVAFTSSIATADDAVQGTRSDKLVERAHAVAIRVGRDHAELTVRRTVWNGGPRHDQATFYVDVPEGAVATGLRTLGERNGQPAWFEGELLEAEAAAARYRELTGIGGYYPKDPALLSWRTQRLLALQVFPCAPKQAKTIEYTYEMPVHYRGGRYHVALPAMGTTALRAQATVSPMEGGDRVFVDGAPVNAGATVTLDKEGLDLAVARRAPEPLDGLFASVPMSRRHAFSHFGIEAAPHLTTAPRGAYVVVVLDASRSLTAGEGEAEVAAARATLAHLPGAHVEVLTFDRAVHARHHGFAPVGAAIADLDHLVVERRNGSRFDDALAQADALLAKAPPGAARRILAITDLRTRSELTPEKALGIVKSGALLHIGVIADADPKLTRDDEHPWAGVARATRGLLWQASASAPPIDAPEMKRVYEEWARPVRVHHLGVSAKGPLPGELSFPETLDEGEGIEDLRLPDKPFTEIVLTGELWAEPVRKVLSPDEGEGKLWSAMAFGSDQINQLDEKEMMFLAMRGHAVSPVTSLLAIEPGVRPSTEGLDGVDEGGGGFGEGIGLQGIGTLGHGTGAGFDRRAYLAEALKRGAAACGAAGRAMRVELETTRDEVVDVPAVALHDAPDAKIQGCVAEAAWALDLPSAFSDEMERFTIEI
jgi:von Willebrand factor type A domain